MKYAVIVKHTSDAYRVYATSTTLAGIRRRYSRAFDLCAYMTVGLITVSESVRKGDLLEPSCVERTVAGYIRPE